MYYWYTADTAINWQLITENAFPYLDSLTGELFASTGSGPAHQRYNTSRCIVVGGLDLFLNLQKPTAHEQFQIYWGAKAHSVFGSDVEVGLLLW